MTMGSGFMSKVKNSGHRSEVDVRGAGFMFRILDHLVLVGVLLGASCPDGRVHIQGFEDRRGAMFITRLHAHF